MNLKKVVQKLDRTTDSFILAICIILLFIGIYSLLDNLWVYKNAIDDSLFNYKPELNEILTDDKKITGKQMAWIELPDTGIDYPVFQGDDNMEYLNKSPYGEFSLSGSIFLDSRNDPLFTDPYSVIYGHHMENMIMFGALDQFLDKSFFDTHKTGRLVTVDSIYQFDAFSLISAEATNDVLFNPGYLDRGKTVEYLRNYSTFFEEPANNGQLLALSTCAGDNDLSRLLLVGTLSKVQP